MTDERPTPPDLPAYLLDPLERQSPARLDDVEAYAAALAAWKRRKREAETERERAAESVDRKELARLAARDVSTDPADYERVPADGAYVTIKETKPGYRYYYWQWRAGDSWENEYIAPVDPAGDGEG
jgi:hypothetical protein